MRIKVKVDCETIDKTYTKISEDVAETQFEDIMDSFKSEIKTQLEKNNIRSITGITYKAYRLKNTAEESCLDPVHWLISRNLVKILEESFYRGDYRISKGGGGAGTMYYLGIPVIIDNSTYDNMTLEVDVAND